MVLAFVFPFWLNGDTGAALKLWENTAINIPSRSSWVLQRNHSFPFITQLWGGTDDVARWVATFLLWDSISSSLLFLNSTSEAGVRILLLFSRKWNQEWKTCFLPKGQEINSFSWLVSHLKLNYSSDTLWCSRIVLFIFYLTLIWNSK